MCVSAQLSYRSVFMSYRTDRVEILDTFQYNDSVNDYFEREPYSVLVRSKQEGGGKWGPGVRGHSAAPYYMMS